MEPPTHVHRMNDEEQNILYELLAYRDLSPQEAQRQVVLSLRNTPKKKRPKKNSRVQIVTTIGLRD